MKILAVCHRCKHPHIIEVAKCYKSPETMKSLRACMCVECFMKGL